MKCVVCVERKGKRACPAKGAQICAQCCGEKRVLEIDCPEACAYLQASRERDSHWDRHFVPADPAKVAKYQRVVPENEDFIARVEYAIAEQRLSSRDLRDKHVAEAFDLLLRTLRSEESGVLYEQTSDDILVEGLRRQLRAVIEEQRRPSEASADPYALSAPRSNHLKLSSAIEALEFLRDVVGTHMKNSRSAAGYADRLARMMGRGKSVTDSASSIIIPGR